MNNITDVVKNLMIINVIVFFGLGFLPQGILPDFRLFAFGSSHFRPFQLITHMFMHANVQHLLFNMFSLYFLGPMVERYIGSKKFLILYLMAGIVALFFHLGINAIEIAQYTGYDKIRALNTPMLGASGAVYGVMTAFATLFPNTKLMLLFPPVPIKAKFLVAGLVGLDLFSGVSGTAPGIANFAHIGGAVLGFLIIRYWRKTGFR